MSNNTSLTNKKHYLMPMMPPHLSTKPKTSKFFQTNSSYNHSSRDPITMLYQPSGTLLCYLRLRRWKVYVSYDSSVSAAPPNKVLDWSILAFWKRNPTENKRKYCQGQLISNCLFLTLTGSLKRRIERWPSRRKRFYVSNRGNVAYF